MDLSVLRVAFGVCVGLPDLQDSRQPCPIGSCDLGALGCLCELVHSRERCWRFDSRNGSVAKISGPPENGWHMGGADYVRVQVAPI